MKRVSIISIFILLAALTTGAQELRAPDFEIVTLEGEKLSFMQDLKGKKPVYLVFWATWCHVCREELPHLDKLYAQLGDKIEIIGVNVGVNESLGKVKNYVERNNIRYKVYFDNRQRLVKSFDIYATPTNILIDIEGRIVYRSPIVPLNLEKELQSLLNP